MCFTILGAASNQQMQKGLNLGPDMLVLSKSNMKWNLHQW